MLSAYRQRTRFFRLFIYIMLLSSAGISIFLGETFFSTLKNDSIPDLLSYAAPGCFAFFSVIYAIDRWILVKQQQYPPIRAILQVALALLFLVLLFNRLNTPNKIYASKALQFLLQHADPQVRAAACDLIPVSRLNVYSIQPWLQQRLTTESDSNVLNACQRALKKLKKQTDLPIPP